MGRRIYIGKTKNAHLVKDSHRCAICNRDKTETNFTVDMTRDNPIVRNRCNRKECIYDKTTIMKDKSNRVPIKEQIDLYFESLNG